MSHELILNVPDPIYEPLANAAKLAGTSPEQVAVQWLEAASSGPADDPLEKFIGALRSDVPDWADQHDRYLGQALMDGDQAAKRSEG